MSFVERMAPLRGGYAHRSYAADDAVWGTPWRRAGLAMGIAFFALGGSVLDPANLDIANLVFVGVLGSVALNLLMGVAGQISIGNAALMAIGAYTAAPLAIDLGFPVPVVVVLAALAAGVVGLLVGIPSLRLRGLYLVIATLALHFIVLYIVERYQGEVTGAAGFVMPIASLGGWEIDDPHEWYYVLGIVAIASTVLVNGLLRSKYGRAWRAIRDRDVAAEILGVNIAAAKLLAFVISSTIIGAQGALYAYYVGVVESNTFSMILAVKFLAMVIIGGAGSLLGCILGATFVQALPFVVTDVVEALPSSMPGSAFLDENILEVQNLLYGLSIVGFVMFEPAGLVAVWHRIRSVVTAWPFAPATAPAVDR